MNSVLVVEDEWISQELAQRALQRLGLAYIAVRQGVARRVVYVFS